MFQSKNWLEHALVHNVEQTLSEKELHSYLKKKKQLRIKFGVDVTNPLIHIGNAVNLWKMREFQEQGHKVIFLIGDFTSLIGDPTGKSKTRPQRTREEIERDAKTYVTQATKILLSDKKVFEVRRNSEWYDTMKLDEFLKLCSKITHGRLVQRDMFQKRIAEGTEIYVHEMLYPILQGYDSYMLQSDFTIIGSDQLFNELIGRHYQTLFGQDPQVIMTTVITPGIDGKEKQSKSLGNFIAVSDTPEDKFGKIMSIPDELIMLYSRVYTFVDPKILIEREAALAGGSNPRDIKIQLAEDLVSLYHGKEISKKTKAQFISIFSQKKIPENLKDYSAKHGERWDEFLVHTKFSSSKSEAKRLIQGGGVDFNEMRIEEPSTRIETSGTAKIGKTRFIRIEVK